MKFITAFVLFLFSQLAIGAVVCGTQDDTASIQNAIDNNTPGLYGAVMVELPPGECRVSSLNITDRQGVLLVGAGILNTRIIPITSGVNVIDVTGSSNITLRDFRICGYCDMSVSPKIGILAAQKNGSASSDVLSIERVRVDGKFQLASFFALGVQSSLIYGSQFYNYLGITAILTTNNFFGASSAYVPIDTGANAPVSDWTITASEFHNMNNNWAFWIGGAESVRVYGGNMSSQHIVVSINTTQNGTGGTQKPGWIIFDGTTFYSDNGIQPACAVQNPGDSVTFRSNQTSMPLTGC